METEKVLENDFDGVFRFSNNSDEDFKVLWNNKEYTFAAKSRSPMIIMGESPENVQEIRKKFAFKWAEKEWYKSAEYERMKKMGAGLPPTRDDKVLEPLIQMCLDPLPAAKVTIKDVPPKKENYKATKAVAEGGNLNQTFAEETKDENLLKVGLQADRV